MGPNTTGLPATKDYVLGRGIVYLSTLGSNLVPSLYRDIGNVPSFKIKITPKTLDHMSSRTGTNLIDKTVFLEKAVEISFEFDEFNDENLALAWSGAKTSFTNSAIAGFTSRAIATAVPASAGGVWVDLQNAAGVRAYDVKSNKVVLHSSTGPVLLVEGTDYTLDLEMGRVFLISPFVNFVPADDLLCVLTADGAARVVDEVDALTLPQIVAAVKFIGENPADNNKQYEFDFFNVLLKNTAESDMISDAFAKLALTGNCQKSTAFAGQTFRKRSVRDAS